ATKVKLKTKFIKLTDNDLLFMNGGQTELIKRLQIKLGLSKEEIYEIISNL
ncbi:MAG: general stress protein CsbD, partial [Bacteroidetes bacterium HGW-Bacteroidetes-12]